MVNAVPQILGQSGSAVVLHDECYVVLMDMTCCVLSFRNSCMICIMITCDRKVLAVVVACVVVARVVIAS